MRLPDDEETALNDQAASEGRSKQEITRDAVRVYLLRNRRWPAPIFADEESVDLGGPVTKDDIRNIMSRQA